MNRLAKGVNQRGLLDFMSWANHAITDRRLRLPAVQRGALWDHRQITSIWDSLLAGMPVGMFCLVEAGMGGRHFLTDERIACTSEDSLDLLDGQQRLRAMMLGFMHPAESRMCLWVDLTKEVSNCAGVQFLLTTPGRPFGWNVNGEKLSWSSRNNESERLRDRLAISREEPDNKLFDIALRKRAGCPPEPSVAKNAVPLHELMALWQNCESRFSSEAQVKFSGKGDVSNKVIDQLAFGFETLKASSMALFLLPPEKVRGEGGDKWLLNWFGRIGRGGTPLSIEEQNYSTYKHYQPDIVEAVKQVQESGKIMSATHIVDTAIRIANATRSDVQKRSFARADPADFSALMEKNSDFADSLKRVLSTIGGDVGLAATGKLVLAFKALSDSVLFKETVPKLQPHGLPRFMVASLPRELLQVLALWLVLYPDEASAPQVRGEMIRLSLYWSLCVGNQGRALTAAFKVISAQKNLAHRGSTGFPGHTIYREIAADQNTNFPLIAPVDLRKYLLRKGSPAGLPRWSFLFEQPLDDFEDWQKGISRFAQTWWLRSQTILMWLQAEYLEKRLPNYDPLAIEQEDTSFDLDHVLPQSFFGRPEFPGASVEVREGFNAGWHLYRESIGNKCWLASSDNRAAGDKTVHAKIKSLSEHPDSAIGMLRLGGNHAEEIDLVWAECPEGNKLWSPDRITGFRTVVEDRVLRLYDEFWREAGFATWADEPSGLDPTGMRDTPEQTMDDAGSIPA